MLIIFKTSIINLQNATGFECHKTKIFFYFPYLDQYDEHAEFWFEFEHEEKAKTAFDRIIYAYANEYRTLDLSEYE